MQTIRRFYLETFKMILPMSYSILTKRTLLGIVNNVATSAESRPREIDFYNINTF